MTLFPPKGSPYEAKVRALGAVGSFSNLREARNLSSYPNAGAWARFQQLLHAWNEVDGQNSTCSVMAELYMSAPYQSIIGMGQAALPFIVEELRKEPGYWFWALKAITQQDPVPPDHRGNLDQMRADWLAWAEAQGL